MMTEVRDEVGIESTVPAIEIARYPIRCANCGLTDEVRVVADGEPTDTEAYHQSAGELLTRRIAPSGWTWRRDDSGQPRWICPDCSR